MVFPVAAVEGAALIFAQNLPHEGEPVDEGCTKYIIRTDVMYERVDKRCDSSVHREAYKLFREAKLAEADKECDRAMKMYARCTRMMSSALAKELGI